MWQMLAVPTAAKMALKTQMEWMQTLATYRVLLPVES